MTARKLLALLKRKGCTVLRQRGSHVMVECGTCRAVVPVHAGQTLGSGLLRSIERELEPCLGERWVPR